jgi:hypothetical protein
MIRQTHARHKAPGAFRATPAPFTRRRVTVVAR